VIAKILQILGLQPQISKVFFKIAVFFSYIKLFLGIVVLRRWLRQWPAAFWSIEIALGSDPKLRISFGKCCAL
jgi:hypothetical protein